MGSTAKKLMTMIVYPIIENGVLTGMLMASINIDALAKNTDEHKLTERSYTFITDESGLVIDYNSCNYRRHNYDCKMIGILRCRIDLM